MCLKDKCITSVIKHAFTPNTYLKNSKCLQKCNKRMTYHNTHWNGNANNRNPHYKKHTSNYILTPLNSKVMPTKFQLCKINTSGFLKVFPRLNYYELIVDDKQYIKLLTKIMLQLCLVSGTTLKLKTRDEHKTTSEFHTTEYDLRLYLGSWDQYESLWWKFYLTNRVLALSLHATMTGVVSPPYKAQLLRLPDHHMFLHVIGSYGVVLIPRITCFPLIPPLNH